jgi:cytochrome o ubiquinol oxidase subunit 2
LDVRLTSTGKPVPATDGTGYKLRRAVTYLAVIASECGMSGCRSGVLDPQGPVGAAERTILLNSLALMLPIVVPTIVTTLAFAWWFRASNTRARYFPDWEYSGKIELVIWSIPTLVTLFLGGVIWIGSHDLDPARPLNSDVKPLNIQVVSLDWKWLFLYPDQDIASVNELVVPAGTPLHLELTSGSVMNAFFVPRLGSMIYTMNGMITQLNLQADREGNYNGRSTQFSGDGFSGMQFTLRAVSVGAFDAWMQATQGASPILDKDSYTALAQQSADVPPSAYRLHDPNLFHLIATRALPSGPGPNMGRPTPDVSPRMGG